MLRREASRSSDFYGGIPPNQNVCIMLYEKLITYKLIYKYIYLREKKTWLLSWLYNVEDSKEPPQHCVCELVCVCVCFLLHETHIRTQMHTRVGGVLLFL